MSNPSRVPAGVPTGGRFAATPHAEAVVDLSVDDDAGSDLDPFRFDADGSAADPCIECGEPVEVDPDGVSHHLDEDGNVDFDADADHVALSGQTAEDHWRMSHTFQDPVTGRQFRGDGKPASVCPDCGNAYVSAEALDVHACESGADGPDLPPLEAHALADSFREAMARRIEAEESDPWEDRVAWNRYLNDLRSARCWVVNDHSVGARMPGLHSQTAGDLLDAASQTFSYDPDDARIDEEPNGSHTLRWGLKTPPPGPDPDKPRQVDEHDHQVAKTIYEQIGPIAAGNMDAKARNAVTVPNGIRMQGCLMGARRRVDVTVTLNGGDLYDVDVVRSATLRTPGGKQVFSTTDVHAGQIRGLMLDIGDGNDDKLKGWAPATPAPDPGRDVRTTVQRLTQGERIEFEDGRGHLWKPLSNPRKWLCYRPGADEATVTMHADGGGASWDVSVDRGVDDPGTGRPAFDTAEGSAPTVEEALLAMDRALAEINRARG